jgi:GNAT superfamily N-acetyltransferase
MAPEGEAIERAALEALHGLADEMIASCLGLRLVRLADGAASMATALPAGALTVNRVLGLGVERPLTPGAVIDAVNLYRTAGVSRFLLHLHPAAANDAVLAALDHAGLHPARGWQKLSRDLADLPSGDASDLLVREIDERQGEVFARIVAASFELGDAAVPWLARLPGHCGWRAFLTYDGTVPVGAGALFVHRHVAWTDFGATDPGHRGRGAHAASLAVRLQAAQQAGCVRVHTWSVEAPSSGLEPALATILRHGFRPDYLRPNWGPPRAD